MSQASIHPTAVISPEAELADNVSVGPYAVIQGKVVIGPDCVIRPGAYLYGPMTMGRGNSVFTGAVLGERPQHLRFRDEPTTLEIGANNIFREHVTVHRGTDAKHKTVIGNDNFLMAGCHVAHDCVIGNRCFLINGALLGGHCVISDGVYLSGNSAVHQFVRIGRLAMLSGCSAATKDMPPFVVQQDFNCVVGVNIVGMRRAGINNEDIAAVKDAFRLIYREGLVLPAALEKIEKSLGHNAAVQEMINFLQEPGRGFSGMRGRHRAEAA